MNKILEKIREYINSPRKQYNLLKNKSYWNQLCSSLDVIEDCDLAISAYENTEFNNGDGDKYLRLYGLLQTVFVQQDAVKNLWKALEIESNFELGDELEKIRNIRNESIGHPTKTFRNSCHFISRITMEKSGFQLLSYRDNRMFFENINIIEIIEKQRNLLSDKLNIILESLKKEEKSHQDMFKMKNLEEAFHSTYTYHVSGVFESILSPEKRPVGIAHLEQVKNILDKLKKLLKERGIEIDTYDSIKMVYDELEYPIKELDDFFDEKTEQNKVNDKTAYIIAFFVKEKIEELKSIIEEIDKEYQNDQNQ